MIGETADFSTVLFVFAPFLVAALAAVAMAVRAIGRRGATQTQLGRYRALVEGIDVVSFEYAPKRDEIRYVSPQVERLLGSPDGSELLRDAIHPADRERVRGVVRAYVAGATTGRIEYRLLRSDGGVVHVRTLLGTRSEELLLGVTFDATRQTRIEAERREAHKLESVGRLAAGVAHEINTPVQFTQDSLQFVRESMTELAQSIERHRAITRASAHPDAETALAADELADLEYLLFHVPLALERAAGGLDRVSTIVSSLRQLAPAATADRTTIDLHDTLGETLAEARATYEAVCEIAADISELPRIAGNRAELRQVFVDLLGNAARAIEDATAGSGRRGTIAVTARRDGEDVAISIADTGTGIAPEVRHLVFEPFFTTRAVGQARGQGLAVARAVIARHGGTLTFESEVGKGSTFSIRLPIATRKPSLTVGVAA
jgi:signal transduction histidine kinase